jgi:TM2 domain-containing membrane protein YozV
MTEATNTGKSTTAAWLLWFFLGSVGAHRFYLGKTGSGIGMAGLFVGSCVLTLVLIGLVGFVALGVWWIVDAFLMSGWLKQQATDVVGTVQPEPLPEAA